ncbi:MAG: O-antigen ligase family protein [Campylobacteraceae bacterium]|jgi:O-antigen ligase|nr:O-antigen ligase family protein [Campylobacteraceae bacterium]
MRIRLRALKETSHVKILFGHFFATVLFAAILSIPLANVQIYPKAMVVLILLTCLYIFSFKRVHAFLNILLLYKDLVILIATLSACMIASMFLNRITSSYSWDGVYQVIFIHFFGLLALLFFYREGLFERGKKLILFFMILSFGIELISGFAQIFFQLNFIKGIFGSLQDGLTGTTINRNIFGFYMAFGTVLVFFKIMKLQKAIKMRYLVLQILFLVGLLFSYSRASWVFVFAFMLSYTALFFKQMRQKDILLFLSVFFLFAIAFVFSDALGDRFSSMIEGDSSNRFEIWQTTIQLIKQKLLLGYGVRNFDFEITGAYFPHNFILDILYSVGILGFSVSVVLLILTYKEIIKTNLIYLPLFFSFFAIMQFDHDITSRRALSMLMLFAFFIFSKRVDISDAKRGKSYNNFDIKY